MQTSSSFITREVRSSLVCYVQNAGDWAGGKYSPCTFPRRYSTSSLPPQRRLEQQAKQHTNKLACNIHILNYAESRRDVFSKLNTVCDSQADVER